MNKKNCNEFQYFLQRHTKQNIIIIHFFYFRSTLNVIYLLSIKIVKLYYKDLPLGIDIKIVKQTVGT